MALGPDRVQVLKQESASLGGDSADSVDYPSPIDPQEDALESAGIFLQDASNRDENVYIARESGRAVVRDLTSAESPIVSELAHDALASLVHLADGVGGPMALASSGAYREILPSASAFPTSIIWWTDNTMTKKVVQKIVTFDGQKRVTQLQWSAYASDGTTVIAQVTDVINYSAVFETNRTRTVT